jgi:DNA polymerase-3 subunit alpha
LGIPTAAIEALIPSIVERTQGDERTDALAETFATTPEGKRFPKAYPQMAVAARLEGHPRNPSRHAAGVVIAPRPIIEIAAVDARTGETHCDKKDAEACGLLKIDVLASTQSSIFEECLARVGLERDHLNRVPLDDPAEVLTNLISASTAAAVNW